MKQFLTDHFVSKKHPESQNAIVIDEETRWVAEKIFTLAAHGAGTAKITRELVPAQISIPERVCKPGTEQAYLSALNRQLI